MDWEFKVNKSLITNKKLSRDARFLYIVIKSFQSPSQPEPFPSLEHLSDICQSTTKSIQRWLNELESENLIIRKKVKAIGGKFASNHYVFTEGHSTPTVQTPTVSRPTANVPLRLNHSEDLTTLKKVQEDASSEAPLLALDVAPVKSLKRQLTDGWNAAYQEAHQYTYKFGGVKDGRAADDLLKLGLSVDQILSIAAQAWKRPLDFNCKQASSLAGFSSRFNEIRAEIKTPYGNNGKPPPENPRNVGTCETTTDYAAASRKCQNRVMVSEVVETPKSSPTAAADAAEALRLLKESL